MDLLERIEKELNLD